MLPEPRPSVRGNHDLSRYILPTERVVVATRRHRAALLEPAVTAVLVFLLIGAIVAVVPASAKDAAGWLWVLWVAALVRFLFRWVEWRHEWFVSTDKRLLLLYGLVIHKVAMMPLTKVTDMGYTRTPLGQLLGYGRFVMESAGQDQALRQIDYVPSPDETYRTLCAEIFRAPTGARPPAPGGPQAPGEVAPVPGGPTRPPVVIVPGRADTPEHRPSTQPIPVAGSKPAPVPVAPAPVPVEPATPPWKPTEWVRPAPYDPHPH